MRFGFGLSRVGVRFLGFAAAVAAAVLAVPAPAPAKTTTSALGLGPAGAGTEAEGRVRFQSRLRGDRVKVVLRDLEPRTPYEVRDAATDSVLARLTTNRRGRGRASFRAAKLPGGEAVSLAGLPLEVCRAGEDMPVLEGEVPGGRDDGGDGNGGGDDRPNWDDCEYRYGIASTGPDAAVQAALVLTSFRVPDGEKSYDSMAAFVTPNSWNYLEGKDGGDRPEPVLEGPVTLWIADREGTLRKVATLESGEIVPCDGYDGEDAGDGARMLSGAGVGGIVDGNDGGEDRPDIVLPNYYWWYADNQSDPGLPFGVGSVDDLVGRAFVIRDGRETVLLDGKVPELEVIDCTPPDDGDDFVYEEGTVSTGEDAKIAVTISMTSSSGGGLEKPYDTISLFVTPNVYFLAGMGYGDGSGDRPDFPEIPEIPGPVTFRIAGPEGDLEKVAVIEAQRYDYYGPGASVPDGIWYDPDHFPTTYFWYADNLEGEGLPFGAERVERLSGRKFEVRDGKDRVLLDGVLPDLEPVKWDTPYPGIR
jgi:hypothetical protein